MCTQRLSQGAILIMRVQKASFALATIFVVLVGASVLDGASAGFIYDGYCGYRGGFSTYSVNRAPPPNASAPCPQNLPGSPPPPSYPAVPASPDNGSGRGMQGGLSDGRMNAGMGRR